VIGDFTLTKNGTSAALSGNTISHSHNGHYAITLTTVNTDTIGRLTISVNNASYAMPVFRWDICQPTVYDALFTNAVNTSGGLPAATAAITTLAGAVSTLTAAGVRTELTTELARIDATVSSRSTFAGGAVASVTGNVGGNVVGSVGSISGVTFPSNFASLGINSSGHILRVVLVDTTTTNTDMRGTDNALLAASYTAPLTTAGTAEAVWNALLASYTTAGSFGARVVRSTNSNNSLQLTGSNHAAADVHAFQSDVLTDAAIDATAVALLQAGLATSANQTTIIDRVSYGLTTLVGACSDAQTAAETYTLTLGGSTYTVDYSGLDSSGNRSATTLSKV
jgi:hypothetical protein